MFWKVEGKPSDGGYLACISDMSDGLDVESAASDAPHATAMDPQAAQTVRQGSDRDARFDHTVAVANGGVSPGRRGVDMRSLLNDEASEVVDSSDQEDERMMEGVSHTEANARPQQQLASSEVRDDTVALDAAVTDASARGMGRDGVNKLLLAFELAAATEPSSAVPAAHSTTAESAGMSAVPGEAEQDPKEMRAEASSAKVSKADETSLDDGENGTTDAAVVAPATDSVPAAGGRRTARRTRVPPRYDPANGESSLAKTPKPAKQVAAPAADTIVGETPPQETLTTTSEVELPPSSSPAPKTRATREKRRHGTPSPVRATQPKKAKTSARPKRAAAAGVKYVDAGESEGEEDAVMVIADFEIKSQKAVASEKPISTPPSSARVTKRKTMSDHQYRELLEDNREGGPSSPIEFEPVNDVVLFTLSSVPSGVQLLQCEYCRQTHSVHPTYKCHTCRRAYHDKCFVDAYKSEFNDKDSVEVQLERLSLNGSVSGRPMVRCSSCQAAFIDFFKNRGVHWDCQCPTCTTKPHKIVDYRRVSLKQIIDEHNLEIAMKKEKKGGPAAKKEAVKANPKTKAGAKATRVAQDTVSSDEIQQQTTSSTRVRGSGTKRSRVVEKPPHDSAAVVATTKTVPSVNGSNAASEAVSKRQPPARAGRVRGRVPRDKMADENEPIEEAPPREEAEMMDVDQDIKTQGPADSATALSQNASSYVVNEHNSHVDSANLDDDANKVTLDNLEETIAITKENKQTWKFKIACSPSLKANDSGTYKEATMEWHPTRIPSVKCSCCDKEEQSLKWFVQHTDASLLSETGGNDELSSLYSYVFVIQRDGTMVPLQNVIGLIRRKYAETINERTSSQRRKQENRRSSGADVEKPESENLEEAMAVLRQVKFNLKVAENGGSSKKRGSSRMTSEKVESAMFSCDVVSGDIGKCFKAIQHRDAVLRNQTVDCNVSIDAYKKGTFDVCESAKMPGTIKIKCACCQTLMTASKFRGHARLHDAGTDGPSSQSGHWVIGIYSRDDPLTVVKLDVFFKAIQMLGNQSHINATVESIVSSQEPRT